MKRNLEKWRADGEKLLVENARYDLTSREIAQMIAGLNIDPSEAYLLINRALDIGVAIGTRIKQAK